MDSPVGRLILAATNAGLTRILFAADQDLPANRPESRAACGETSSILGETERQLTDYFAGRRERFDLPLSPSGTPFQLEVWEALQAIPYGATRTYGELAVAIGRPKAVRAVGAANGANPLPIVVPCHRVIGTDGSLTGFGGGMENKRRLLVLEGAWPLENRSP